MSESTDVLLPVGRIVAGNLYRASDKDGDGKPRLIKNGPKAGQPTSQYYFGLAIPKTPGAQHFGSEPWGRGIWAIGNAAFPKIAEGTGFSWKITDGDSATITKPGQTPPNQRVGYPGNWIVALTRSGELGPFKVTNSDGSAYLLDPDVVQAGDLVEVHVTVRSNESSQRPGVYVNANIVAFVGYSPLGRISQGVDPNSLGLGKSNRPTTVAAPIGGTAPSLPAPAPAAAAPPPLPPGLPSAAPALPAAPVAAPVAVAPAPSYLGVAAPIPAPPAAPVRQMIGQAAGFTFESMIASGWTEATLIQHGLMTVG